MPSLRFRFVRWYLKRSARSEMGKTPAERRAMTEKLATVTRRRKDALAESANAGGVPAEWVTIPGASTRHAILFLHGGYYITGSVATHRNFMGHLSQATGARMLLLDYRLAPENPFPAALDDALAAYHWLLAQGFAADRLAVVGDSAGGGLALATALALRDAGLPRPAAIICLSPWTDLACTGPSLFTNAGRDFPELGVARLSAEQYLAGADPRNPLASPLYADLRGLPPLLLQVGGHEILLDDATRLADCARTVGVPVELQVWPEMFHEWQQLVGLVPEAGRAVAAIGAFVRRHLAG